MRTVLNFCREWYFVRHVEQPPKEIPNDAKEVHLPHTWNAIDGQDGGGDYFRGRCAYMKSFRRAQLPEGTRRFLEFLGANSIAEVYLNGKHLETHEGGYSTFRVEITEDVIEENLLVVVVDNSKNSHVYPQTADFTFYGGLYRGVNVIAVEGTHFDLMYYGSDAIKITPTVLGKAAQVDIEVYLTGAVNSMELEFEIFDKNGTPISRERTCADITSVTLDIPRVNLWHGRRDPYLYSAEVTLIKDGCAIDSISSRFGCRSFSVDPERGFILNGEEYPLRGVSRHQDREGIGNALLREHHREDAELIMEVGATAVRLAHYQHDSYFYDLCDELGLVVWAEIPYISHHLKDGDDNTKSQLRELIIQNYNHPSIVFWGLSNEITLSGESDSALIENHSDLESLAKNLDSTRLTAVAAVSMCPTDAEYLRIPDLVAYNHYFGWYGGDVSMNGEWFDKFHTDYPKIPIGVSEYGCEALNWHTSVPTMGDYTEEYQAYYHEELIRQLFSRKYLFATYVWNMFDFGADARMEGGENGRNHKGLVTFDRKYKKDSFYAYKAWLSSEPFVHICSKRYIDRVESRTKIKIYSNLPEVELFVDGKSVGKKESSDHFFEFEIENKGEQALLAVAGEDFKDESRIRKVDTFNEEYRLREQGAIINWFDITTPDGRLSLNDKIDDILKIAEGREMFSRLTSKLKNRGSDTSAFDLGRGEDMMKMLGGFTLLRFLSLLKMMDIDFTKEELLKINSQLNKIEKPQ